MGKLGGERVVDRGRVDGMGVGGWCMVGMGGLSPALIKLWGYYE